MINIKVRAGVRSIQMKSVIPLLCLIVFATILEIKAAENSCLALAYCNLVRGDLAKQLKAKDAGLFDKEAETAVGNYKKYIQKKDDSVKDGCKKLLQLCIEETGKTATYDMKFPTKYRTSCSYETYSNAIFDCKNIKNWPKKVKDVLPSSYKDCSTTCSIEEPTPVKLANGKSLSKWTSYTPPSGDQDIEDARAETREIANGREYLLIGPAYENYTNESPGWFGVALCEKGKWAAEGDYQLVGGYLYHIALRCYKPEQIDGGSKVISSGYSPTLRYPYTAEYNKTWSIRCNDKTSFGPRTPENGFLVGFAANTYFNEKLRGHHIRNLNYYCAYYGISRSPKSSVDVPIITCPYRHGVFGVQVQAGQRGGVGVIVDVKMACCDIGEEFKAYVHNKWTPVPTVPTTTLAPVVIPNRDPNTLDKLIKLQIKSFHFWDNDEVHNYIITRYNYYYTPTQFYNEDSWVQAKCPPGTFVTKFIVKDPKACYYEGRRIFVPDFVCGTTGLDITNRITSQRHTLVGEKFTIEKECQGGHYNAVELVYHTVKERQYLVNAWSWAMRCSTGNTFDGHRVLVNAAGNDLSGNFNHTAIEECDPGKAICGIDNKIAHNHIGTVEGFFFRIICCDV